jgi:hypothetical protein
MFSALNRRRAVTNLAGLFLSLLPDHWSLLQNSRTPTAILMPEGAVWLLKVLCDEKVAVESIFRRGSLEVSGFPTRRDHALTVAPRFCFGSSQTA